MTKIKARESKSRKKKEQLKSCLSSPLTAALVVFQSHPTPPSFPLSLSLLLGVDDAASERKQWQQRYQRRVDVAFPSCRGSSPPACQKAENKTQSLKKKEM
jgi:hypothetical protein